MQSKDILFEKFEIVETLKKDEFSGVYLANHVYLGKEIILKVLETNVLPDSSLIERFKREAKILARLDHQNIIKVLDFGAYDQSFYISFEYFESKNLRAFIKSNLTDAEKRNLIVQLFKGLNYAHQHGIIHRDIKPENILVNEEGLLKIGDFGLALGANDKLVTSKYSIVGTPCYMAPEQILGEQLDVRCDLFSVGVVIYELLTGRNPLLGRDMNETINKVISYDEDEFFKSLTDLENDYQEILKGLMKKKSSDRFTCLEEALALLEIKPDVPVKKKKDSKKPILFLLTVMLIVAVLIYLLIPAKKEIQNEKENATLTRIDTISSRPVKIDETVTEKEPKEKTEVNDKLVKQEETPGKKSDVSPPKVVFGKLMVECSPWANVYINSEKFDTTPLEKPISLPCGEYDVKLVHPDYPQYSTRVKIGSENMSFIKVKLDTLFGFLRCEVFPWGEIFINGKSYGQTPLQSPIKLIPGNYNVTIKNLDLNPYSESILIQRNKTLTVKHKFKTEIK